MPAAVLVPPSLARLVADLLDADGLDQAACRDQPGNWDDILDGEDLDTRDARLRAAIEVCRSCPARQGCAQLVASYGPLDTYGVWAGVLYRGRDRRPRSARAV